MASPAPHPNRLALRLPKQQVARVLCDLFHAAGLSERAAGRISDVLIEADLEGLPSHGVMQAEVYLDRLRLGSVSPREEAELVLDRDAVAVLNSHHMLGHLAAEQAMALAVAKAKLFGLGAVAVRNAFHFGAAGRYARQAAAQDCIGIAMCNSRPTMPAPGGAQKLAGTNPVAISVPTAAAPPIVLDMATSAGTVARIRLAAKSGKPIPVGWAITAEGEPTTDPTAALAGMLLPMGGAKGFGLSLIIDLMSGLLSSGAWGDAVPGMHIDLTKPSDSAHCFLALNVAHFRPLTEFLDLSSQAAERVRRSRKAQGTTRIYTPGERKWENARSSDGMIRLEAAQVDGLLRLAGLLDVDAAILQQAGQPGKAPAAANVASSRS